MKKTLSLLIVLFFTLFSLSAAVFTVFPDNVSFYSDVFNVYSNPAAIAFREDLKSKFIIGFTYGDTLDSTIIKEPLALVQSLDNNLNISFGGAKMLFSAAFGYRTSDRKLLDNGVSYDFISSNNIQLDWGYRIKDFAAGIRIKGGSSAIRDNKVISDYLGFFQNFLLAEYTNLDGSNYFSMGLGAQYHINIFSFGLYTDSLLTLDQSKDLSVSLSNILDTLTFGFSVRREKYTPAGELSFYRPRVGLSLKNIFSDIFTFEATAELTLQFLPNRNLSFIALYGDERSKNSILKVNDSSSYVGLGLTLNYDKLYTSIQFQNSFLKDNKYKLIIKASLFM